LEDQSQPNKQRRTAPSGYGAESRARLSGGYTVVKDYMRQARLRHKEVHVPLAHPSGMRRPISASENISRNQAKGSTAFRLRLAMKLSSTAGVLQPKSCGSSIAGS
jgi:hypothetical protein